MSELPAFVVAADPPAERPADRITLAALIEPVRRGCEARLGFAAPVHAAGLRDALGEPTDELPAALAVAHQSGARDLFVVPASLGLSFRAKLHLAETVQHARRTLPDAHVAFSDADPCHPLLVQALVDRCCEALAARGGPAAPDRMGVLLVAAGDGDPEQRARSYQLMRLVWEQLGAARGDVAFLRHARSPLPEKLAECDRTGTPWLIVPQYLWYAEHQGYIDLLVRDFALVHPGASAFTVAPPLGAHPNVARWLEGELAELWESSRRRRRARRPSPRRDRPSALHGPERSAPLTAAGDAIPDDLRYGDAAIATVGDRAELARVIRGFGITSETVLVKVTWHGYAPGTYTDPSALDALLAALPGRAILLEGHTASRNRGGADWDWEADCRDHRDWIRAEEREYLARTGLQAVIDRHGARYVNVTDAWWDGGCADPAEVEARLTARGVQVAHRDLLGMVPAELLDHAGAPFISFARFKGPTRLSVSNCFGLIPTPLRTAWHGPNITFFARVCCDIARVYGGLFASFGMVEGLDAAVRWARDGLYRSRWGNYDLVTRPDLVCISRGLAGADVLASRLQGQDVQRSAFFDVVRCELGYPDELARAPIDDALRLRLA